MICGCFMVPLEDEDSFKILNRSSYSKMLYKLNTCIVAIFRTVMSIPYWCSSSIVALNKLFVVVS